MALATPQKTARRLLFALRLDSQGVGHGCLCPWVLVHCVRVGQLKLQARLDPGQVTSTPCQAATGAISMSTSYHNRHWNTWQHGARLNSTARNFGHHACLWHSTKVVPQNSLHYMCCKPAHNNLSSSCLIIKPHHSHPARPIHDRTSPPVKTFATFVPVSGSMH